MSTFWPLRIPPPKHGCKSQSGYVGALCQPLPHHGAGLFCLAVALPTCFACRLRLPLPLSERAGRCRRPLDPVGGHCAAGLARSGAEGAHERAAARVRREAGARVTTNTRLAGLNLVDSVKDRR